MAQWIEDPQGRPEVEKVTKELKLPVWKANHKGKFRDFWNELWDKIEDYILKLKGDTENNSKGLNDRLVSAVGKHDGDFPITNAVVGNVYYSELTKKYYKCKVGGPAPMPNGNFIDMSILENLNRLQNLIKVDTGITGDYITLGSYTYNFPKSYNKVLGVAINIYKTGTATTLENVYLTGFNNTSFSFVKDCVESPKANSVKIAYTVFYI
ncbi:hypothetical protein [Fusobacterium nucleatum]|uniref:hypothetical protein n=1 Tax=Fusobacterium nucleatum TaxID=851 RepID=UPI0030CFEAA1